MSFFAFVLALVGIVGIGLCCLWFIFACFSLLAHLADGDLAGFLVSSFEIAISLGLAYGIYLLFLT